MNANSIRTTPALQRTRTFFAVASIAIAIFLGVAQPASAAAYQYCCVNVQAGVAARYDATLGNTFAGWVTPDQFLGRPSNTHVPMSGATKTAPGRRKPSAATVGSPSMSTFPRDGSATSSCTPPTCTTRPASLAAELLEQGGPGIRSRMPGPPVSPVAEHAIAPGRIEKRPRRNAHNEGTWSEQ